MKILLYNENKSIFDIFDYILKKLMNTLFSLLGKNIHKLKNKIKENQILKVKIVILELI